MEAEQYELPDLVSLVELPEWKGILLDLVRSERMDPWDIDIVYLAQKYLERIRSMQSNNLYVPANALLACAILLNMKADVIKQYFVEGDATEDDLPEAPVEDFALLFDEPVDLGGDLVDDSAADAEPSSPPEVLPPARVTARRVTLEELLAAMERVMRAKKRVPSASARVNVPPIEDLFEEIEREDVDHLIEETYQRVLHSLDSEGLTTLSRILPDNSAESIVKTFLPILYLANDGRLVVWQEKPFEEIFIAVNEDGKESKSGADS